MQAELFKGRTAIVTGGARGIGLACAAKIVAGGGRVALWDRDLERARQAAETLGNAAAIEVDVTSEASMASARDVAPAISPDAKRLGRSDNRLVPAGRADAMPELLADKWGGARRRGNVFRFNSRRF